MKQLTLQEQYNLLNEGKGNKNAFMKSALKQFPNLFNNFTEFDTAVGVLKQKQIISEGAGGVVTSGNPFINWEKFLNEESNESKGDKEIKALEKEASKYSKNDVRYKELQKKIGDLKSDKEYAQPGSKAAEKFSKSLNEEAKAEEKKPTKEVVDMETAGYDYKDKKNIDNLYGEAFLQGYYTEMKDPKNADKTVDELKEMVAKNMEKDMNYYMKEASFGIKGIGYTDDVPGLKVSDKEIKGKYASSGMEEVKLKEGKMVNLTDLLNEAIGGYIDLRPSGMTNENARTDAEEEGYLDGMRDEKEDLEDKAKDKKKKVKKETLDSKLAEIEKAGKVTTLEAQIEALEEAIETKNQRISMVSEDENLSELVDKKKMKEMQREVKLLEKKKAGMEKMYEKLAGKAYVKTEIVDEADEMDY
jgi:hypothetical protein